MDTLQGYGSSGEEDNSGPFVTTEAATTEVDVAPAEDGDEEEVDATDAFGLGAVERRGTASGAGAEAYGKDVVAAAPEVIGEDKSDGALLTRPTDTQMNVNVPYADMMRPIVGPANPWSDKKMINQNVLSGHAEETTMNDFDFRLQQRTFQTQGYARNPSLYASTTNAPFVGNLALARIQNGATALDVKSPKGAVREHRKKRKGRDGDPSIVEGEGAYVGPWGGWEGENIGVPTGPTEEEIARAEELSTTKRRKEEDEREEKKKEDRTGMEKSIFHGKSMYDYQGRTYMHVPQDVDVDLNSEPGSQEAFIPKKCIHTWTGHTKGVSAIRLFPRSGHLLLSASMDSKIKLWDVYREGKCLRTFMGHSKAVRDITFSNDGRRFLSAGYDRQMKLWDTETGQCLKAFYNGKIPYVVKFHPDDDKQHIFLAGMSDKKIIQYDINSGEITQEYDQHLGPVNTITFVDDNRRFVTTSDDKTMRAWDFDIPVVIKYIAEPSMHSMPAVTVHPNKKWFACQSLDNQVVVYAADSFRQNRKKIFKGHTVSGYACQVGFSPDGRFLSSGDGEGNLFFWDWKTSRYLTKLRAHKEVVIDHAWLPHETSKLVTASWDGTIKLWD